MELWLMAALLSALVTVALVWVPKRPATLLPDSAPRLEIYKNQLIELDRDLARGLVEQREAESQRAEISRRLLGAARETAVAASPVSRTLAVVSALAVPVLAFGIYATLGVPSMPDLPQSQRLSSAEKVGDIDAMVYKVERHLAVNPDDATGWRMLLSTYGGMGRHADMAEAYRQLIRISGSSAELQSGLAEALTTANRGLVSPEANAAAQAALRLDAREPRARFFVALALAQDNKPKAALDAFTSLLNDSPADAPWRSPVEREIAALQKDNALAPPLTEEQMQTGSAMPAAEQGEMIAGMVDLLAMKLASNPNDLDGWLRLIRARMVLRQTDIARLALANARKVFGEDPAALASLQTLAKDLKLE